MILIQVPAGSSSIVADIQNLCAGLSPLANWQGFYYKDVSGEWDWVVWAMRMDDTSDELQIVFARGKDAPPDYYYPLKTVAIPTLTGFTLSFTQVNAMPKIFQKGKESSDVSHHSGGGAGVVEIRMSASSANVPATAVADFLTVINNLTPSGTVQKFFYVAGHGDAVWEAFAICQSGAHSTIWFYSISNQNGVETGSEMVNAVSCPTTTLLADGFTQLNGPVRFRVNGRVLDAPDEITFGLQWKSEFLNPHI